LPDNIKLIFTSRNGDDNIADLIGGDNLWLEAKIEDLNKNDSKIFIENYMLQYNKVINVAFLVKK
jgi:hypothetical protein